MTNTLWHFQLLLHHISSPHSFRSSYPSQFLQPLHNSSSTRLQINNCDIQISKSHMTWYCDSVEVMSMRLFGLETSHAEVEVGALTTPVQLTSDRTPQATIATTQKTYSIHQSITPQISQLVIQSINQSITESISYTVSQSASQSVI